VAIAPPRDQRTRILDAALGLMAERGARGMSMRRLAAACDLNVATLYHYFPSKQDLFREAIAHGRYDALLANPFPDGLAGPPEARLAALLDHLFAEMVDTGDLWRVLLSECLHGDDDVLAPLLEMSAAFEHALGAWLADIVPDAAIDRQAVRLLRHAVYGVLIEHLPQADVPARRDALAERARDIASVFLRLAHDPAGARS